jgi:hypothetical protein
MKTTYLLPCQCGEKLQVDASESGLVMKCRCGASLEVPTMRGLSRLERVMVEAAPGPASSWGGAQRGMAVGALVVLLGLAFAIYWTVRPLPRAEDLFDDGELAKLGLDRNEEAITETKLGTVQLWRRIQSQGLTLADPKLVEKYRMERRVHVWWRLVGFIVAGLGLAVLGTSAAIYWGRSPRSPRRQPVAAASS